MTIQEKAERIIRNRYFAFAAIVVVVALIIVIAFSERGTQLLPASTLAYASCFLLTIYFLRKQMTSIFDIILTSAATTFSGVWLYEVTYHYFWGTSLGALKYDFSNLSIVLYPGWAFPTYFAIAIILFPFLKRRYISLNIPLVAIFGLSLGLFALWAYLGYPQYFVTTDPTAIGYWMNSITKILAVVPAFLFCDIGRINLGRKNGKMQKQVSSEVSRTEITLN